MESWDHVESWNCGVMEVARCRDSLHGYGGITEVGKALQDHQVQPLRIMEVWDHGAMELWNPNHGIMKLCGHGIMELWNR